MEIDCIFEIVQDSLAAIKYKEDEKDCFDECFSKWGDIEYLEKFFHQNESDLQDEFWNLSCEDAVLKVLEEAEQFKNNIIDVAEKGNLDSHIFVPLHKNDIAIKRSESKAYGRVDRGAMLRLYAIRLGENVYVITGGAIKLTKQLQEREHTAQELKKLKYVADYLKKLGIDDDTDYGYLEFANKN
ncbi:hypothetical protein [Sphingobacterium sp. UGAL515B_05]|uniref:hypothetical protein n=1 Tax=Sphingobacterium sp. UGAL515B_05 TaxID=2986767 RepID=UPI00295391C1|nr:hypothetical protein [Sphingobacterium sp. UGAL515B_05]WON92523.1 hypothetical protein OK025_14885 [Sphingobacterium sp. UGAL515B_05]